MIYLFFLLLKNLPKKIFKLFSRAKNDTTREYLMQST